MTDGLERLKNAVLDKARAEAEALLSRARGEAEALLASARGQAEKCAADVVEKAKLDAKEDERRELAAVEREVRMKSLGGKNAVIDEALERAAKRFAALPPARQAEIFRAEAAGVDMSGAVVKVTPGAKEAFSAAASGARVEEDKAISAGYIITRADYRLDRSLGARIEEARRELRTELAGILFGGPR